MPDSMYGSAKSASPLLRPMLHLGFALTGVGTVLLGSILPRLSQQWHLRDKDTGLLLLIQFAGSASGSLFVRRNLFRTLSLGYALFGAGAIGVFLLQQRPLFVLGPGFAILGLGLGLAMTSTNLLVGQDQAKRRGAALAILNFSWSAGAVACPLLAARFLRHAEASAAFGLLGLLVLPCVLLPLLAGGWGRSAPAPRQPMLSGTREMPTIATFAALAFLYVGVESTLGNWMSTYATRTTDWHFIGGSLVVSSFWAAFLMGRAATPAVLVWVPERLLYRMAALATLGGVGLLLAAHSPRVILAGALLSGLSLAPLFPLTLSLFLASIGSTQNAGWVFLSAGMGGAVLSWLTGSVSSNTGSLRVGLLVPAFAALLMMAMITRLQNRKTEGSLMETSAAEKIV